MSRPGTGQPPPPDSSSPCTKYNLGSGHKAPVGAIAWAGNGKRLASGSDEGIVKLWTIDYANIGKTDKSDYETQHGSRECITALAFNPKKDDMLAIIGSNVTKVCDLRAKSSASVVIEAPTPDAIAATWDNHDNLVVLQLNNTITHIDPRRKRTHKPQVFREGDEATDVAFIEGGRKLLISTRYGVEVWSWPALDCLTVLVGHLSHHGRDGGVTAMAVSKQDRLLASGGMDAQICIWDLQAGIPLTVAHQPDGIIRALSFNTDQQMLAYSQSPVAGQQPYLDVVSAVTGKFMYRVPIAEPTESIAFNPRYPRILAFAAEKYYSGYKDRSSKEIYYGRIGVISFGR